MEATKRPPWTLQHIGVTDTGPNGEDVFDIELGDPMQVRICTVAGADRARLIVTACNHFTDLVEKITDPRLDPPCDGSSREDDYHWFADFELWRQEARALLAKIKEG